MKTRGRRKEMIGTVISDKMQKTIVVETETRVSHPLYNKEYLRRASFKAHDEKGEARIGDRVRIRETRPVSKSKRWNLVEIVKAGKVREMAEAAENA